MKRLRRLCHNWRGINNIYRKEYGVGWRFAPDLSGSRQRPVIGCFNTKINLAVPLNSTNFFCGLGNFGV
jgi:hypothetical protein